MPLYREQNSPHQSNADAATPTAGTQPKFRRNFFINTPDITDAPTQKIPKEKDRNGEKQKIETGEWVQFSDETRAEMKTFLGSYFNNIHKVYLHEGPGVLKAQPHALKLLELMGGTTEQVHKINGKDVLANEKFGEDLGGKLDQVLNTPQGWAVAKELLDQQTELQLFSAGFILESLPPGERDTIGKALEGIYKIYTGKGEGIIHKGGIKALRTVEEHAETIMKSLTGLGVSEATIGTITKVLTSSTLGAVGAGAIGALLIGAGKLTYESARKSGLTIERKPHLEALRSIQQDEDLRKYVKATLGIDANDFTITADGKIETHNPQSTQPIGRLLTGIFSNTVTADGYYNALGVPASERDIMPSQFLFAGDGMGLPQRTGEWTAKRIQERFQQKGGQTAEVSDEWGNPPNSPLYRRFENMQALENTHPVENINANYLDQWGQTPDSPFWCRMDGSRWARVNFRFDQNNFSPASQALLSNPTNLSPGQDLPTDIWGQGSDNPFYGRANSRALNIPGTAHHVPRQERRQVWVNDVPETVIRLGKSERQPRAAKTLTVKGRQVEIPFTSRKGRQATPDVFAPAVPGHWEDQVVTVQDTVYETTNLLTFNLSTLRARDSIGNTPRDRGFLLPPTPDNPNLERNYQDNFLNQTTNPNFPQGLDRFGRPPGHPLFAIDDGNGNNVAMLINPNFLVIDRFGQDATSVFFRRVDGNTLPPIGDTNQENIIRRRREAREDVLMELTQELAERINGKKEIGEIGKLEEKKAVREPGGRIYEAQKKQIEKEKPLIQNDISHIEQQLESLSTCHEALIQSRRIVTDFLHQKFGAQFPDANAALQALQGVLQNPSTSIIIDGHPVTSLADEVAFLKGEEQKMYQNLPQNPSQKVIDAATAAFERKYSTRYEMYATNQKKIYEIMSEIQSTLLEQQNKQQELAETGTIAKNTEEVTSSLKADFFDLADPGRIGKTMQNKNVTIALTQAELLTLSFNELLSRINTLRLQGSSLKKPIQFGWPVEENDNEENRQKLLHAIAEAKAINNADYLFNNIGGDFIRITTSPEGASEVQLLLYTTQVIVAAMDRNGYFWPPRITQADKEQLIASAKEIAEKRLAERQKAIAEVLKRHQAELARVTESAGKIDLADSPEYQQIDVSIDALKNQGNLFGSISDIMTDPEKYLPHIQRSAIAAGPNNLPPSIPARNDGKKIDEVPLAEQQGYTKDEKDTHESIGYYTLLNMLFGYQERPDRAEYFKKISQVITPQVLTELLQAQGINGSDLGEMVYNLGDQLDNHELTPPKCMQIMQGVLDSIYQRAMALP